MSTICKICALEKEDNVVSSLGDILRNSGKTYKVSKTQWPLSGEHDNFIAEDDQPSMLSLKQVTDDVTEIYYNSFNNMKNFASLLSRELSTAVLVIQYQSTSTYCYWAFHKNGELLREIEAGEGEVITDLGAKFDFENAVLGKNIADEGEEPYYFFDYEDMDSHNKHLGFDTEVYQDYGENWVNFIIDT